MLAVESLLEMGVKSPEGKYCGDDEKEDDINEENLAWISALGMNDGDGGEDYENADEDSTTTVDDDVSLDGSDDDVKEGDEDNKGSDDDNQFSETIRDYVHDPKELFIITELEDLKKRANVD